MQKFATIRVSDVARWMGLSPRELYRFALRIDDQFLPTRESKVKGKVRLIDAPKRHAKPLLRRLHRGLQAMKLFHGSAHGGIEQRSTFTSAGVHLGRWFVWTRDAKDCFPSITRQRMLAELRALGFDHDVARLLSFLFIVRGRVPQGSPVSTDAVNLYFYRLDQKVASEAGKYDIGRSRVVDDLVISGENKAAGERIALLIEHELGESGLKVNDKKRRAVGLQSRHNAQLVHNLRVNDPKGIRICSDHLATVNRLSCEYIDACNRVTADSLMALAHRRKVLEGHLHYIAQADLSPHSRWKKRLFFGDRQVIRELGEVALYAYRNKWWLMSPKRNEPQRLARLWKERVLATTVAHSQATEVPEGLDFQFEV